MDYHKLMLSYREEMLNSLKEFLSINSIYDQDTVSEGKPFGNGVYLALQYIANLGKKLGFSVDYCDGYCSELTIGEGDKMIGIYAHADVVPVTGNWVTPPFSPDIRDGKLFARGSSDDKGPLIAALYATKALRDAGILKDYRVRIVVGGDEERGSRCLEHYFEVLKKEGPTYGFTPDSDFPLIYGEKGIVDFWPTLKLDIPHVKSISGGSATNAVNDATEVEMEKDEKFVSFLKENNIEFKESKKGIIFLGKTCHGSTPQLGKNAALIALKALGDFYKIEKLSKIGEKLMDGSGKSFDGYSHSELLGDTTYCVGVIKYENGELKFSVNFRYNELVDAKAFNKHFNEYFGVESNMGEPSRVLLFDPKCKMVQTMLKAYREETGDMSEPLTTGGGTYAKHASNTVAFGALFAHTPSTMHEPNEYIPLDDFYKSADIYAHAIALLGELNED